MISSPTQRGAARYEPNVICYWGIDERYLSCLLFPSAQRVECELLGDVTSALSALPDGTTVLPQINLSITSRVSLLNPTLVNGLSRRGVSILNAGITDTTKSALWQLLHSCGLESLPALREGPADELVIVKTTHNYGAGSERRLSGAVLANLGIPPPSPLVTRSLAYIVSARSELPVALWDDPSLVVERFVENRFGAFMRVYLLGERLMVSYARTPDRIKKMRGNVFDRRDYFLSFDRGNPSGMDPLIAKAAQAVATLARTCNLAFAALDLVFDDTNNVYIVDLNLTPIWNREAPDTLLESLATFFELPASSR